MKAFYYQHGSTPDLRVTNENLFYVTEEDWRGDQRLNVTIRASFVTEAEAVTERAALEAASKAAASLGRRGGAAKSDAKAAAVRENGKRGGRPISWHNRAQQRVDSEPRLKAHEDFIMADWKEGAEHWQWIAEATVDEIVDWVEANH
jgi:hypothetical protein